MKRVLLLGAFGLCTALSAQDEARFSTQVAFDTVALEETFQVTYTVENAEVTQFEPPQFRDFSIVAGPMTSTSISIINGHTTRSASYTYHLKPTRLGKLEIPAAKAKTRESQLQSEKSTVVVVNQLRTPRAPQSPRDMFGFGGGFPQNDFFNQPFPNADLFSLDPFGGMGGFGNMDQMHRQMQEQFEQMQRMMDQQFPQLGAPNLAQPRVPGQQTPPATPKKNEKVYRL